MAAKHLVEKEKTDLYDAIGIRVRDVALAIGAFAWSLMFPLTKLENPAPSLQRLLLLAIAIAVVAVVLDYAQMILRYAYLSIVLKKNRNNHDVSFPRYHWLESTAKGLFGAKIICLLAAALFALAASCMFLGAS